MNKIYSQIASTTPLYYYNFTLPAKDIDYLNNNKFKNIYLIIEPIKKITRDFSLYKLINNYNQKAEISDQHGNLK